MVHHMKLNSEPFHAVSSGFKTIELRLNDEKRQKLCVGDCIEFSLTVRPEENIQKTITALHYFPDFEALYATLPLLKCGYTPATLDEAKTEDMDAFYSREAQKKYGVVGIELEEIPFQKYLAGQAGALYPCSDYQTALQEICSELKETHWIWYVLPQIKGLTNDTVTEYFALEHINEAREYYHHPILGTRLTEILNALLALKTSDPVSVFGMIDAYKLRASMTLFRHAVVETSVFQRVLDKFCLGTEDERTLAVLQSHSGYEPAAI